MSDYMVKHIGGYREITRRKGDHFPYIVAQFQKPDVFAVGVMDPTDPKSWQGEVSDAVLYFYITPEEYGWLRTDAARLDCLASRIQGSLPRNRYFMGMTRQKVDQKEFDLHCEELLREDSLPDDETFDKWKKQQPLRWIRQEKSLVTIARKELAEFQRDFDEHKASDEDKKEEQRRERTLGYRLMESDHIYAALDCCSPGGIWPGLEPKSGDAFLFTDLQIAQSACDFYENNQILYYKVQEIRKDNYPQFFQNCEMLGVQKFRLDDGLEPVRIDRRNIYPDTELSWLEERNQSLRNAMLHSVSLSTQMRQYMDEMDEERRNSLLLMTMGWRRVMLHQLKDALLYVPTALPEELHNVLEGDFVYTQSAMDRMHACLKEQKRPPSAQVPPGFRGKAAAVRANSRRKDEDSDMGKAGGKFPIRVLTTENGEKWILAFTSESLCHTFIARERKGDTMVVFTLDEIADQIAGVSGILLDFTGLGIQLREKDINQIHEIADEPDYRSKESQNEANSEARQKDQATLPLDSTVQPAEPVIEPQEEKPMTASDTSEEKEAPQKNNGQESKPGILNRLFRRNKKKKDDSDSSK